MMEPNLHLNLVLLGTIQAGKSASGNTILGRNAFVTNKCSFSVTQDVAIESGRVFGFPVTVHDTPGLCETQISKYQHMLQRYKSGPCVFLLVINADRFTEEERSMEKIEKLLGPNRFNKTWVLFTRGDELNKGNTTIKEFLVRNEALKTLEKYKHRYHVFSNKQRGPSDQARLLLAKIIQTSCVFNASEGGMLPRQITTVTTFTLELDATSHSSKRIVLLGKTGFGKSASGNTILGRKEFKSEIDTNSVTDECSVKHATVSGKSVSVVDTPGFLDTRDEEITDEQLKKEIARSVYLSSPGPHVFLIVLRATDRFTEHEQQVPQMIEMMFGQEVLKYSIILFTHGDLLKGKSMENLIKGNSRLRHLVQECGDRFHIFNNEDQNSRQQVNDLLQKIDTMIEQNGGGHYSNQMFQDAQRFRQKEEERKKREEEWRKYQETEAIRMQNVRAEHESQKIKLERQREEEWRKQEEEIERIRIQMQNMRDYEAQRFILERQREEEWRKQQKETERLRIQMEKIKTEDATQRSEFERLKAERQREEEWRKQQNEKMLNRTQSEPELEEFYRKYMRRFSFSTFIIGKVKLGIGAVCSGVLGAAVGAIAGPPGVAAGAVLGTAVGGALGTVFDSIF